MNICVDKANIHYIIAGLGWKNMPCHDDDDAKCFVKD